MTTVTIGSLAWEPPYAVGGTLKAKKAKNKNNDKKKEMWGFPSWLSSNELDEYPLGHGFDLWPHSVG